MNLFIRTFFLLSFFFLASCSPRLTTLTQKVMSENQWEEKDLKRIQFYLSNDIVLTRKQSTDKSTIRKGEVQVTKGQKVEQIVFKRGTPGLIVNYPKKGQVAISFDARDDEKFLVFGKNKNMNNKYTLMGSNWTSESGVVNYANEKWSVSSDAAYVNLLLNLKKSIKTKVKVKQASGRRIR